MFLQWEIPLIVLFEHISLSEDTQRLYLVILESPYLSQSIHASRENDGYVCFTDEFDSFYDVFVCLPLCYLVELELFEQWFYFSVSILT